MLFQKQKVVVDVCFLKPVVCLIKELIIISGVEWKKYNGLSFCNTLVAFCNNNNN